MRTSVKLRKLEKLIVDSSLKIKQIVDASPYGVHVYELKDDGRLIFTNYNSAADKILGLNHSRLLDKEILDAFPNLSETKIPDTYKKIATDGIKLENEMVGYEDQNIKGAFEVSAFQIAPNKIATFFSDITEKQKAFDELLISKIPFYFDSHQIAQGCFNHAGCT